MKNLYSLLFLLTSFICSAQYQPTNDVTSSKHTIVTNDQLIENTLNEFFETASMVGVDFEQGMRELKSVKLVDDNLNFIGSNDNGQILINSKLLYYPNLLRWVLFNQLGQHYGLKLDKSDARIIMYSKIELNPRSEYYAETLRNARTQKKIFFQKLKKKLPLALRI